MTNEGLIKIKTMRKKEYIIPQVGVLHIAGSTCILAGSPETTTEKGWITNPDDITTPTEIKEEKPGELPGQISGAKQWSAWDWDD